MSDIRRISERQIFTNDLASS